MSCNWNEYFFNLSTIINRRASLVPAVAVIPAPMASCDKLSSLGADYTKKGGPQEGFEYERSSYTTQNGNV